MRELEIQFFKSVWNGEHATNTKYPCGIVEIT